MKNFSFVRSLSFLIFAALVSSSVHAAATNEPYNPNKKTAAEAADEAYRKSLALTKPKVDPVQQYEKAMEPIHNMAIQQATAAIQKDAKDSKSYAQRANAYNAKKDYANALPDYDKAIELDPKNGALYSKRAIVHYLQKNYDKSWKDVEAAKRNGTEMTPAFIDALKSVSKRKS